MKVSPYVTSAVAIVVFTVIFTVGTLFRSQHLHAQNPENNHESRVERGFELAPVPLNLEGKDRGRQNHWRGFLCRRESSQAQATIRH